MSPDARASRKRSLSAFSASGWSASVFSSSKAWRALNLSPHTVRARLARMKRRGKVTREFERHGRGRRGLYSLAEPEGARTEMHKAVRAALVANNRDAD